MAFHASGRLSTYLLQTASCAAFTIAPLLAQVGSNHTKNATDRVSPELPTKYEQWLDQDVRWIMSNQERVAFIHLTSDRDRERFIEEFWRRRDPTPDTPENEFKEEHYRRLAYANMHFGWGKIAGWETDRGRLYIFYGPPDTIKDEPTVMAGGGFKNAEIWHYNSVEHLNFTSDMNVRFIDFCGCGDYRMQGNPTRFDMPQLFVHRQDTYR
jgi:GWxTD domain-containing protein